MHLWIHSVEIGWSYMRHPPASEMLKIAQILRQGVETALARESEYYINGLETGSLSKSRRLVAFVSGCS